MVSVPPGVTSLTMCAHRHCERDVALLAPGPYHWQSLGRMECTQRPVFCMSTYLQIITPTKCSIECMWSAFLMLWNASSLEFLPEMQSPIGPPPGPSPPTKRLPALWASTLGLCGRAPAAVPSPTATHGYPQACTPPPELTAPLQSTGPGKRPCPGPGLGHLGGEFLDLGGGHGLWVGLVPWPCRRLHR